MDKIKAFLTQKLNKDSFKDVNVKRSIKLTIVGALIIALMIQAIGCFCAPFTVSAVDDDSIVGTWVLNPSLSISNTFTSLNITGQLNFANGDNDVVVSFDTWSCNQYLQINCTLGRQQYYADSSTTVGSLQGPDVRSITSGGLYTYVDKSSSRGVLLRTIIITGGTDINNQDFISFLNDNGVKQAEQVYDFTGETRIFNDELTLFNTTEATWTEAFGFNFEVLGVGTADYLTLQRTTQNNYNMSYSFDFEGSGGLTMIYRDTPPLDDGNGEWLGGKVNRKVITFLSNPGDPEFQQWLLDNTELFNDVDFAYQIGFTSGYNNGYEEGFSNKLIGDTLKGPIEALSALTIIEVQGVAITLGGVVMTAIALCLVLAFLKLYAGG